MEILMCFYIMGALWKAQTYILGEREIKTKLGMNLKKKRLRRMQLTEAQNARVKKIKHCWLHSN